MRSPSTATGIAAAALATVVIAGCDSSSSSSSPAAASKPSSTPAGSSAGTATVTVTTKHDKLGTILAAGDKRLTVYLFEADKTGRSACSGACATAWPPVMGTGKATGGAKAADLGTVTRPGGGTQVTYKGHPLYYFIKDEDDGDAYGQGSKAFGAGWYVLSPSGQKIDNS